MNIKVKGHIVVEHFRNGKLLSRTEKDNTITNAALAVFAGLIGNTGSQVAFTFLAIGTSNTAPAASQTALVAETAVSGLTRVAATVSRITTTQTNDTLQLVHTWTAGGSATIQEVGIFNDASVGVMAGRALTTSKPLSTSDTLTVTYTIQFS